MKGRMSGVQGAPGQDTVDADGNDRERGEVHCPVLGVAQAELVLGAVVFVAVGQDVGPAAEHDPGEAGPVLVPSVDSDGDGGVLLDIADALEGDAGALRLLVNGDVERVVVEAEADGHQMGYGVVADGREMGDADEVEEAALGLGEHGGTVRVALWKAPIMAEVGAATKMLMMSRGKSWGVAKTVRSNFPYVGSVTLDRVWDRSSCCG
jgi:hypothetical protein